ncbi:MAG: alpha/beta fold hydrolase [Ilumatobacter sp.]|jgi:pimeloyl-ACP methyl ester carboxylesterase|uniref:alpha/beta fold hydrolase n=1 Tax=Ilumatobacter sp. TaxID=1967498 RepID=UPI00391A9CED
MVKREPLRHVRIHGHDVSYRRLGEEHDQAVLLIHGLAGSSKTWDAVIGPVGERYDVIAPDLLGHGESAKPVGDYSLGAFASGLRDFLAMLEVDSVTIVGHSFGGGVAMQLAYQHPHLVDRLVLVGSGGLGREVSPLLRMLALPGAEYLMPLGMPKVVVDGATSVGRLLGRRNIRSAKLGEFWRAYSSLAGASNRQAFVKTMRGVIEPGGQTVNATDRLYLAARVPVMIVWGDHDGVIPVAHGVAAHEAIEHSRLEILDGIGHFPHVEAPERFVEVLLDFLATTEPGPDQATLREVMLANDERS